MFFYPAQGTNEWFAIWPSEIASIVWWVINTLRPRQNGCHLADDIFKWILQNENVWIPNKFLQLIRNTPKPSVSSSLVPIYINAQEPCFLIQPPEQEGRCQDDAQRSVY